MSALFDMLASFSTGYSVLCLLGTSLISDQAITGIKVGSVGICGLLAINEIISSGMEIYRATTPKDSISSNDIKTLDTPIAINEGSALLEKANTSTRSCCIL